MATPEIADILKMIQVDNLTFEAYGIRDISDQIVITPIDGPPSPDAA
jgi:hypothetical protein